MLCQTADKEKTKWSNKERTKWSNYKVGDILDMVGKKSESLYEVTVMGSKFTNYHLKAVCFFGPAEEIGRKITLYKLHKDDE